MDDKQLIQLLTVVHDKKGFDFTQYKEATITRRINSRLQRLGLDSYDDYIKIIESDPVELNELVSALSINVTDFFRNPESFEAIEKIVIPRVIYSKKEHQHKIIRVWSCGCSTGDEPYSLAMLLLEKLGPAKDNFILKIIGTDIDEDALKQAKDMVYSKSKLKVFEPGMLKKYFDQIDDDSFKLKNILKNSVQFKHQDVNRGDPVRHCDIILCRNLLIYFNKELQEETLLKFYECLEPGGFLVLGMVESLVGTAINYFEMVDNRLRIYRKPDWLSKSEESSKMLSQDEIDKIVYEMLEGEGE